TLVDVLAARHEREHAPPVLAERREAGANRLAHALVLGARRDPALGLAPAHVEPHARAARLHHLAPGLAPAPVDEDVLQRVVARAQAAGEAPHDAAPSAPAPAGAEDGLLGQPAAHL